MGNPVFYAGSDDDDFDDLGRFKRRPRSARPGGRHREHGLGAVRIAPPSQPPPQTFPYSRDLGRVPSAAAPAAAAADLLAGDVSRRRRNLRRLLTTYHHLTTTGNLPVGEEFDDSSDTDFSLFGTPISIRRDGALAGRGATATASSSSESSSSPTTAQELVLPTSRLLIPAADPAVYPPSILGRRRRDDVNGHFTVTSGASTTTPSPSSLTTRAIRRNILPPTTTMGDFFGDVLSSDDEEEDENDTGIAAVNASLFARRQAAVTPPMRGRRPPPLPSMPIAERYAAHRPRTGIVRRHHHAVAVPHSAANARRTVMYIPVGRPPVPAQGESVAQAPSPPRSGAVRGMRNLSIGVSENSAFRITTITEQGEAQQPQELLPPPLPSRERSTVSQRVLQIRALFDHVSTAASGDNGDTTFSQQQ